MLPWSFDARLGRLLRRARSGDREAFRELYRSLYLRIWSYLARRSVKREDCEDLTARTFERLLLRMEQWDESRGSVVAFVLGIARNLLLDDLRTAQRMSRRMDAIGASDDAQLLDQATPHWLLERAEAMREVRDRLERLPAETRELFSLRFVDGLAHREIAALLGIAEAAVKQRFSRALRELRQGLPGFESEPSSSLNKEVAR